MTCQKHFKMRHRFFALLLFIGIGLSSIQGDPTGYDVFIADDDDLHAFDAQTLTQDGSNNDNSMMNFDSFSSFVDDINEANADLFAGCSSTDRLGARNEKSTCSTNELSIPHLPTLDELTNTIEPLGPDDGPLTNHEVPLYPTMDPLAKEYICPPHRPFYLCCICQANFRFSLCQDCLPSRSYFFAHIYVPAIAFEFWGTFPKCVPEGNAYGVQWFFLSAQIKADGCNSVYAMGGCFAPHMAVCCLTFGVLYEVRFSWIKPGCFDLIGADIFQPDVMSLSNLDIWTSMYRNFDPGLRVHGGTIAEYCSDEEFLFPETQ